MLRIRTGVVRGYFPVPVPRVQGAGLHQIRPGVQTDPLGPEGPAGLLQRGEQRRPAARAAGARVHVHPGELDGARVEEPYAPAGQGLAREAKPTTNRPVGGTSPSSGSSARPRSISASVAGRFQYRPATSA